MTFKFYKNQSFASGHEYLVMQAILREAKAGNYIHFQVPGPPMNRDYGFCFDVQVTNSAEWDKIKGLFKTAEIEVQKEEEKKEVPSDEELSEEIELMKKKLADLIAGWEKE